MKNIIMTTVLLAVPAFAGENIQLTEGYLKKLIDKKPPSIQQIEMSFLSAKYSQFSAEDRLGFRIDGSARMYRSDERLLSNFDGAVTKSSRNYSLGLVKPTRYGVDLGLEVFAQKSTNAFVADGSTTGASISLAVDLYQDFLGRRTNSGLKKGALALKRAELEKKSSVKTFESNIRKLYWSLVANNERKKLYKSLVSTAKKQYRTAQRKRKSGAADSGEVARARSQWTSRQADVLSLDYQKANILKSLKEMIPDLNGKNINLGPYSEDRVFAKVMACTQVIDSYKTAPFQNTVYDEIVKLLEQEEKLSKKETSRSNGPNVKFIGEYSSVGRGLGLGNSRQDFNDNAQPRLSLGLQVSIPLGGGKKKTKEVLEELNKNKYQSEARANLSKINAYHSETVRLVKTLRAVLRTQKETNKHLKKSLRVSRRKYKQARISLQELISEQDFYTQSELKEINSQITIINILMDYFSVYTDIPCAFNKI